MNEKSTKRDIYKEVTDRIIAALEEGCAPWVKPWSTEGCSTDIPINGATRRSYRGVNTMLLWLTQASIGYTSREWFTFKQVGELGGKVIRGEKATLVVFWKQIEVEDEESSEPGATKTVPILKHFNVFNRDQIEGLPDSPPPPVRNWAPIERAEAMVQASGASIAHIGSRACFMPGPDTIRMPAQGAFQNAGDYYATLLHELTHWTGHESRLARQYGKRFGDTAYAREELVAEMGSAFLCASLDLVGQLQHPEYINNWLSVLKDDKRAVFTAASHAQKAADFLHAKLDADMVFQPDMAFCEEHEIPSFLVWQSREQCAADNPGAEILGYLPGEIEEPTLADCGHSACSQFYIDTGIRQCAMTMEGESRQSGLPLVSS